MYELLPSGLQIFPIYLQTLGNILTTIVWLYSIFEFKRRTPIKKRSMYEMHMILVVLVTAS